MAWSPWLMVYIGKSSISATQEWAETPLLEELGKIESLNQGREPFSRCEALSNHLC
jgi:hypothetical protein